MCQTNTRRLLGALLIACFAFGSVAQADQIFVAINSKRMGDFPGEVPNSNKHFEALTVDFQASSPRDTSAGTARAIRQYEPIRLTKLSGIASLQAMQAYITNDVLNLVTIDFVRPAEDGVPRIYQTIRLGDARIVGVTRKAGADADHPLRSVDEIAIQFTRFEIIDPVSGFSVVDQGTAIR